MAAKTLAMKYTMMVRALQFKPEQEKPTMTIAIEIGMS